MGIFESLGVILDSATTGIVASVNVVSTTAVHTERVVDELGQAAVAHACQVNKDASDILAKRAPRAVPKK